MAWLTEFHVLAQQSGKLNVHIGPVAAKKDHMVTWTPPDDIVLHATKVHSHPILSFVATPDEGAKNLPLRVLIRDKQRADRLHLQHEFLLRSGDPRVLQVVLDPRRLHKGSNRIIFERPAKTGSFGNVRVHHAAVWFIRDRPKA